MLTEAAIRAAKRRDKPYKLFDERGLYLLIDPKYSPGWRFKYYFEGREKLLSLGTYPDVSLKRARERRDEVRQLILDGINPSAERQAKKAALADSFESVAREWLGKQTNLSEATRLRDAGRLERFAFSQIGSRPVSAIKPADLLAVLRRVEAQGKIETTHRVRSLCGRVLRYAVATGRAEHDVSADLRGALAPLEVKNRAAITDPKRIGELLRAMDDYSGQPATMAALKLAPLTFVRPGELRAAEWTEFDLDQAVWRIPAARMKMAEQHLVPLSRQAVSILRELHAMTGDGKYLFPSLRTPMRCMSDNTVNAALRRLGYSKEEMTGHGFRAMASTCLNEQGWHPDVIELQLAHKERNKVRAAYNRAERLAERKKMMQAWADYLDGLKAKGAVVAIRSKRFG
ncbi:tyrosine-type recombinase/integrase [Peristeroidobacter agariperforans]|uniref:tyrosine-type recombinase/integrase n=1 Tax=Peristeroidobacter agariperforans TaxID=268404 RepID=UPI00101D77EC|nr:integrase arm-type DNA-binding domain-containing protein [Peristeroidobacter agariperforans]